MQARIWMAMAWSAAWVAVLASASGCAVSNGGALTANGRFWSKAGRLTDRVTLTEPYVHADAYLSETHFAADPGASCPHQATGGIHSESKELVRP